MLKKIVRNGKIPLYKLLHKENERLFSNIGLYSDTEH